MTTADALTPYQSKAELWIAYHRKTIISLAGVVAAALNVLRDSAQTPDGINASSVVIAVLALAQAVFTYLPDNAQAKLVASGVMAIGSGITGAVTNGISVASLMVVLTQLVVWVAAGATENGARPDVVRSSQVSSGR